MCIASSTKLSVRALRFSTCIDLDELIDMIHAFHRPRVVLMRDVADTVDGSKAPVVLRFDVERRLGHHLELATRLSQSGIHCTFYFHSRLECYRKGVLKAIQDMGHEVGYHHECLDRASGDFGRARELFLRDIEAFRRDGLQVATVCSHGEAGLRKIGYKNNLDLLTHYPDLMHEAGLLTEVYLWLRDTAPLYASDTFTRYRRFWRNMRAGVDSERSFMMLAHLHRWHDNPAASALEIVRDLANHASNRMGLPKRHEYAH